VSDVPVIELRGVSLRYPGAASQALSDVSLRVDAGEAIGIAGQNGSGKTSLAKLLNGLLRPTTGTVAIDGRDSARRSVQELAATVGFVFQNPGHQLFASSVAAEVAYGPKAMGLDSAQVEQRVAEALEAFGLTAHASTHPRRLGYPLRKLVAIASVLAMRPSIVVFDEPTTGQDHRTTALIEELIARLRRDGVTVVCVSHDMPLLAQVATRLVVLREGRIIADGTPREAFSDADAMGRAGLAPPQISEISMRLPWRAGQPAALSVAELAEELR
jgi:energy-coupling factor transport system ATP-binding protein